MKQARQGTVYLVGAGPGDPELLTLKAVRLLNTADVVLHDDLVPQPVLAHAAHAIVINVGKRCGRKNISQEQIDAMMVDYARRGLSVIRLKSGDPLVFGRAGEELDAAAPPASAFRQGTTRLVPRSKQPRSPEPRALSTCPAATSAASPRNCVARACPPISPASSSLAPPGRISRFSKPPSPNWTASRRSPRPPSCSPENPSAEHQDKN
jgi:hypothetical protein